MRRGRAALGMLLTLGLSPVWFAACGGDSSSSLEPVSEDTFLSELPRIVCANARKCACEDVPNDCEDQIRARFAAESAYAHDAGLVFNEACGAESLQVVRSLGSCDPNLDEPKLCCKWYDGSIAEGEPCGNGTPGECAAGLECTESWVCERICQQPTYARRGESCFDKPCADGLACSFSTQICVDVPGVGEDCSDTSCGDAAFCRGQSGKFVCVAAAKVGEACQEGDCLWGLHCSNGRCITPKGHGAACSDPSECLTSVCDSGACYGPFPEACGFF